MKEQSSITHNYDLNHKIPNNWQCAKLEDISYINPRSINLDLQDDTEVSFLPMRNVEEQTGKFNLSLSRNYKEVRKGYTSFVNQDIIFAKITPCMENGKIAIVDHLKNDVGFGSTEFHVIRLIGDLSRKFFFYYLLQDDFRKEAKRKMTGTAGQLRVPSKYLEEVLVPVPPVNEQKRIVSKLEELFTRLDAGIEYLRRTKILLKQYRQSVLKDSFEGNLTERWRYKNKNEISRALIIFQKLKNQKSTNKKREFPTVDLETLHKVPEEWMWIRIQDIVDNIQYGTSDKANDNSNGIPVIRMGNIQNGKIIFENLKYYPKSWKGINEFLLSEGDVLFNRTNSAELVGKSAVFESINPKSVFASYLIRLKILINWYNPKLLSFFINSIFGKRYIKQVVSQQVGQANVNGTKLAAMPIPFLSIQEQNIIVREIETKFSLMDHTENMIQKNLSYCQRLRQSILKQAFEGNLVAQNPKDEPAEMLLQRIQQKIKINQINSNRIKNKSNFKQTRLI